MIPPYAVGPVVSQVQVDVHCKRQECYNKSIDKWYFSYTRKFILMEEYQEQSAEQNGNSIGIEHRTYDSEKMIHNFLQSRKLSSTLFSMKERVFSPEARTEEILVRNFAPISVKAVGKGRQKTMESFIQSPYYAKNTEEFFWYLYPQKRLRLYNNEAVIRYIHEKDGKKRSVYMI